MPRRKVPGGEEISLADIPLLVSVCTPLALAVIVLAMVPPLQLNGGASFGWSVYVLLFGGAREEALRVGADRARFWSRSTAARSRHRPRGEDLAARLEGDPRHRASGLRRSTGTEPGHCGRGPVSGAPPWSPTSAYGTQCSWLVPGRAETCAWTWKTSLIRSAVITGTGCASPGRA
jgi:hypothetical protein